MRARALKCCFLCKACHGVHVLRGKNLTITRSDLCLTRLDSGFSHFSLRDKFRWMPGTPFQFPRPLPGCKNSHGTLGKAAVLADNWQILQVPVILSYSYDPIGPLKPAPARLLHSVLEFLSFIFHISCSPPPPHFFNNLQVHLLPKKTKKTISE